MWRLLPRATGDDPQKVVVFIVETPRTCPAVKRELRQRGRCQSALNIDPPSASKIDPSARRLVPVVHRGDPRVAECPHEADAAARGGFLWTHRCKPWWQGDARVRRGS